MTFKNKEDKNAYYRKWSAKRRALGIKRKQYPKSNEAKAKNKEYMRKYNKGQYRQSSEYKARAVQRNREWKKRNPERARLSSIICHWRRKVRAFYKVNSDLICEKCGETDIRVLQINHINGLKPGISKKRRENPTSDSFYGHILTGKIDLSELNLLCSNCNIIWEQEVRKTRWQYLAYKPYTKSDIDWEM